MKLNSNYKKTICAFTSIVLVIIILFQLNDYSSLKQTIRKITQLNNITNSKVNRKYYVHKSISIEQFNKLKTSENEIKIHGSYYDIHAIKVDSNHVELELIYDHFDETIEYFFLLINQQKDNNQQKKTNHKKNYTFLKYYLSNTSIILFQDSKIIHYPYKKGNVSLRSLSIILPPPKRV